VSPRRSLIAACCLATALGVSACGQTSDPPTAENDGVYVIQGPITYQLQISRELNAYSTEDKQYLTGLPAGTTRPAPDQLWYAVFLWAKNQTNHPAMTTDNFDIVDTQGNRYYPLPLNPSVNPFAWIAQTLPPSATQPGLGTVASSGPTGGGLLLFKLDSSVYSNRPLTFQIYQPGENHPSTISLDL
jgi:hypothetical protein